MRKTDGLRYGRRTYLLGSAAPGLRVKEVTEF
jgi:hypothetical protein